MLFASNDQSIHLTVFNQIVGFDAFFPLFLSKWYSSIVSNFFGLVTVIFILMHMSDVFALFQSPQMIHIHCLNDAGFVITEIHG